MMQHTGTLCAALGLGALAFPSAPAEVKGPQTSPEQVIQWRVQHQRTVESLDLLVSLDQRLNFADRRTVDSLLRFTEPAPTRDLRALQAEVERLEAEKLGLEAYLYQRQFGSDADTTVPFPPVVAPTTGLSWGAANEIQDANSAGLDNPSPAGLVDVRRPLAGTQEQEVAEDQPSSGSIQIPRRFEDLKGLSGDAAPRVREANLEVGDSAPQETSRATPEEVFRQARSAYLAERYESALTQLNTLPPTEEHLYWLGRTLEQLERSEEALAAYERAAATGSGELARRAAEDADFLRWQRSLSESVDRAVTGESAPVEATPVDGSAAGEANAQPAGGAPQ